MFNNKFTPPPIFYIFMNCNHRHYVINIFTDSFLHIKTAGSTFHFSNKKNYTLIFSSEWKKKFLRVEQSSNQQNTNRIYYWSCKIGRAVERGSTVWLLSSASVDSALNGYLEKSREGKQGRCVKALDGWTPSPSPRCFQAERPRSWVQHHRLGL